MSGVLFTPPPPRRKKTGVPQSVNSGVDTGGVDGVDIAHGAGIVGTQDSVDTADSSIVEQDDVFDGLEPLNEFGEPDVVSPHVQEFEAQQNMVRGHGKHRKKACVDSGGGSGEHDGGLDVPTMVHRFNLGVGEDGVDSDVALGGLRSDPSFVATEPYDDDEYYASKNKTGVGSGGIVHNDDNAHNANNANSVHNDGTVTTSGFGEPVDEYGFSEQDYVAAEQKAKKKQRTINIAASTVAVVLAAGVGVGVYTWKNYVMEHSVVTPTAVQTIGLTDKVDPCDSFKDFQCETQWVTDDVKPHGALIDQSVVAGSSVKKGDVIKLTYSKGPENVSVPNIVGLSEDDAREQLYQAGLKVANVTRVDSPNKLGSVVDVVGAKKGDILPNGAEVSLSVANGSVRIPDWAGKSKSFVEAESSNLGIKTVFRDEESDKPVGTVISQSVKDAPVSTGDTIEVVVAKPFEDKQVEVPDVLGKSGKDAQSLLAEAGFRKITTVEVQNNAVTKSQVTQVVPGKGQKVSVSSDVTLIVSNPIDEADGK